MRLVDGMRLPWISNVLIYADELRRFSAREHAAVYSLVKGGHLHVMKCLGPQPGNHRASAVGANAEYHYLLTSQLKPYAPNGDNAKLEAIVDQLVDEYRAHGKLGAETLAAELLRGAKAWEVRAVKEEFQRAIAERPYTENAGHYYIWVVDSQDRPIRGEGPYGPFQLGYAKTSARIAAREGRHDRVVSRGVDMDAPSFEVVRQYQRGTGKRLI